MRYKDQATTVFSEIADVIESSDNAENNIYDIVDFMIGIMTKDQLNQVEDMLTNLYPKDSWTNHYSLNTSFKT